MIASQNSDLTFSAFELNNDSGSVFTGIPCAPFTISTKIEGYRNDHHSLLIVACYNVHEELPKRTSQSISVSASDSEELLFNFSNSTGEISCAKIFILAEKNYSPMCKPAVIEHQ